MSAPSNASTRKWSFGGQLVQDSLADVGYALQSNVQMVETARPRSRAADVVLIQNAWNFIPEQEFQELARPYPRGMRRRMLQRRLLARLNTRRAGRVVALTSSMAELAGRYIARPVEVSEVMFPLSLLDEADDDVDLPAERFVLVPGTITWYKDPVVAAAVVASRPELPQRLVFAGTDDGSGCWEEVSRVASTLGQRVTGGPVSPATMRASLRRAAAVVLPSRLESLGFSLSEALALAPGEVMASGLPSHRDLAERVGRTPAWLGGEPSNLLVADQGPQPPDPDDVRASWLRLGRCLGLSRIEEES